MFRERWRGILRISCCLSRFIKGKNMGEDYLYANPDELFADISTLCHNGHKVKFTPKGMSMYPFIVGNRDSVVIQKVAFVRERDIVAARISGNGCVLHRVYSVSENRIVLMGDANLHVTEICSRKEVLATVVSIVRNGRHISCYSVKEQVAVKIWMYLLPLRRYLLWLLRKLRYRL